MFSECCRTACLVVYTVCLFLLPLWYICSDPPSSSRKLSGCSEEEEEEFVQRHEVVRHTAKHRLFFSPNFAAKDPKVNYADASESKTHSGLSCGRTSICTGFHRKLHHVLYLEPILSQNLWPRIAWLRSSCRRSIAWPPRSELGMFPTPRDASYACRTHPAMNAGCRKLLCLRPRCTHPVGCGVMCSIIGVTRLPYTEMLSPSQLFSRCHPPTPRPFFPLGTPFFVSLALPLFISLR